MKKVKQKVIGTKRIREEGAEFVRAPIADDDRASTQNVWWSDELNKKLIDAAEEGDIKKVESLLCSGAYVNARDKHSYYTALMGAAVRGHISVCRFLIENGADVNLQDDLGRTALMKAVRNGQADTCKLLIEKGADVNFQDDEGNTALMWATWSGDTKTLKYLLSVGANPLLKNNDGKTAYDIAIEMDKNFDPYGTWGITTLAQALKRYTTIWKKLGEGRVQKIRIYAKQCLPESMREVILNL